MGSRLPSGAIGVIRVLEVLATLKRAGAETLVASLVSGLDRSRFEPAVVTLYNASPHDLEPAVRASGVPVTRLGKRPGIDVRMFSRLRAVIDEFRPDVVHTHSYVMRYTLPVVRCAAVHTIHNLAVHEVDTVGKLVHRIAFRRGVIPVAVAEEVARSCEEVYGIRPRTILNGIEVSRFGRPEASQAWREAHGFSDSDVLVVSVARLMPQKNPELLAQALPEGFHLLLAGEGPLRDALTGIPRVHLLGVRSDLPEVLSAADVFALASNWEGHPIAVMEALAAGLPTVATAVGGVPEIVGDAGVLVPPGEVKALHDGILAAYADRDKYRAAALVRATRFDIRNTIAGYEEVFEEAVRK
jgi:glycosyltransferase involved in cell wall biosynthesis